MPKQSRSTKQKEAIQTAIDRSSSFFTAEGLQERVKKKHPDIGLATIYRYLKEQRKQKTLYSYRCDGRRIYSRDNPSHCHFICEETGKVIHFDIDSLDFLKDKIPGSISSFQIEVRGVCEKCSRDQR